ncbi:TetR/AcrR family transcriptional regulator [Phenylobacterium sp.]|uniref:TetR/AcrR family transcriptional regulator n=1 Tax=Phenylobacterium sp. TaxID=1871053 RepID=UPI00121092DD|nr:TetR/AcrR family transcriptional regulator C-terminal ligand-binding domain-containing protein [Phenylobacterium sp.]TAL36955.1 MAG: TetR/AcrR family transcriptional regulator [Phenylobacterium sp.]
MSRPKGARDADYDAKRTGLLRRITARLMRRETARPSFRQLAEAGDVSVPTLRHYFGDRPALIGAILESYLETGRRGLDAVAEPTGSLEKSIRDYCAALLAAMRAPRDVRLGDVFAVSIAEGLLDSEIGPATLRHIIDPSVEVLRKRLDAHVARGEMIETDTRAAALFLISPLLLAILHQDHLGGRETSPVDLPAAFDSICAAFLRAYAAPD